MARFISVFSSVFYQKDRNQIKIMPKAMFIVANTLKH